MIFKKNSQIVKLHSEETDYVFWKSKIGLQRLEAIEFLRQQHMKFTNASQRIQKVCTILKKPS